MFNPYSQAKFGLMAVLAVLLNLLFWLGLIGGGLWLIKYFFPNLGA
jgi:hypothetical protein